MFTGDVLTFQYLHCELAAALCHVIGATVSDYYGGSVIIGLAALRQSHVPLTIYVSSIP